MEDVVPSINFNLWESSERTSFHSGGGLDPRRWIRLHSKDAGNSDETVVFRSFVNARLGSQRAKSTGAPYLLVISGRVGESDPRITLCDQTGKLYLSRDCK